MRAAIGVRRAVALVAIGVVSSCGGETTKPVTPTVTKVEVTPPSVALAAGSTVQLAATVRDQSGSLLTGRTITWSSNAPAIATVDAATGLVRAVAVGNAIATAVSEGVTGTASIQVIDIVPLSVASVVIDSNVPPLFVGRTAQLSVAVRDANGVAITDRTVQWTSSAPGIVTVSNTGLLTGVAPGSATITATAGGVSGTRGVVSQAIPSALITLLPEFGSVARGVDYPLTTVITDIDGHPLTGHTVTYSSADPTLATVSPTGVVHPLANGFVTITGIVDGKYPATTRLTVMDPRGITGQVMTADGKSPSNLVFVALAGTGASAQRFATQVDAVSGSFTLQIPAFPASALSIEYFVDAAPGAPRKYHPSYSKLLTGGTPNTARILLIPHAVVPDSGTYAGQTFAVDLNEAFIPVCTNTGDQNCQSYWPSYWLSGIKNWPDAARPIPLAIDRTTASVSAADSTAMWNTIHTMEADLGRSLYAPAAFKGYTSPGYTAGMVLASLDPSVVPFAGYTNWSWDSQGVVYQAKMRLASSQIFANTSTVTHELNHALGFHHTCRWSTVMGGYGCPQQAHLTSGDVAYYHLAEMVRRKASAVNPTWSIVEALQGVRVLELGIASADAIPLSAVQLRARLGLPGSDGAH